MSSVVYIRGMVAVLSTKIEDSESFSENLRDNSKLSINYEGTLVYHRYTESDDIYHLNMTSVMEIGEMYDAFNDELDAHGLAIKEGNIKEYSCLYHNGSDCPMDLLRYDPDSWSK